MSDLKIVMYHYVRDLENSAYPGIKGLDLIQFFRQLDYLQANFNIVTAEEVITASNGGRLPKNACWLTFDDGYVDHFDFVFPELLKRGLQGSFFVPSRPIETNALLDVNAIHYLLASGADILALVQALTTQLKNLDFSDAQIEELKSVFRHADRFDDADTIFFKRVLQKGIDFNSRTKIVSLLINEFLPEDEEVLARKTYMSLSQMRTMQKSGMFFGGHGQNHDWLDSLSEEEQGREISASRSFIGKIGMPTDKWIMCYPYGASNEITHRILRDQKASLGLTTEVRTANFEKDNNFLIPRYDTNDFPS